MSKGWRERIMNKAANGKSAEAELDLRPVAICLNHLPLYDDYSVVINPQMISHWRKNSEGGLTLVMRDEAFELTKDEAIRFAARMARAIKMTHEQIAAQQDSRIVTMEKGM